MEKMKQLNRCPNCGGTFGSIKYGIMRCEYCDSEFLSPYPPHIEVVMPTAEETAEMLKQIMNGECLQRIDADNVVVETIKPKVNEPLLIPLPPYGRKQ